MPASIDKTRVSWDKTGGEDFFDYLNGIEPEERTQARIKFSSVNDDGSIGGLLYSIVGGWENLEEGWVRDKFGPGKFKIELRLPGKTGRRNEWTIVQIGTDQEIKEYKATKQGRSDYGGQSSMGDGGGGALAKSVEIMSDAMKSGIDIVNQATAKAIERTASNADPAGMIKTIMELLPKNDNGNQTFMITLLENQRKEAESRADREATEARQREERYRQEANERATRDREFMELMRENDKARAADREQFFQLILKERDSKADSLNQLATLLTTFVGVREKLDGLGPAGETYAPGLVGLVQALGPKILDTLNNYAPIIAGRMAGTPPPSNGNLAGTTQNPAIASTEHMLLDLVNRLGAYLNTHDPATYNEDYWLEAIFEEYAPIASIIQQAPSDKIIELLKTHPAGKPLFMTDYTIAFVTSLINAIKNPEGNEDIQEASAIEVQPVLPKQERTGKTIKATAA